MIHFFTAKIERHLFRIHSRKLKFDLLQPDSGKQIGEKAENVTTLFINRKSMEASNSMEIAYHC